MSFSSLVNQEDDTSVDPEESRYPDDVLQGSQDGLRKRVAFTEPSQPTRTSASAGQKLTQPRDDSLFAVQDDEQFSLFEKGRDYEPIYITHRYTEQEKNTLNSYESCDYLPNHSHIYRHWIMRQMISKVETDRWIMMGMIGLVVGVIGFLLHQLIERISDLKWTKTKEYLEDGHLFLGWLFCSGYSILFAVFAAGIVVFWRPSASGSGMPEITGFLNGTNVPRILNVKTLVAKFASCVAAIGCGMPIGPEGPMIHMGAIVGAGMSQTSSETLKIKLPFFERFRNPEDRRNFISAGVAAGVAAAFGAPVGGLLFSMEEVSSFWSHTLMWQIFFCCIISTSTSDLFNSALEKFQVVGTFGQFRTSRYILFNVDEAVDINILMFIPSVILGIIGGLLGSLFTILNLKIHRYRKRKLVSLGRPILTKIIRLAEPAAIMLIMSTLAVFLPMAFSCVPFTCIKGDTGIISEYCVNDTMNKYDTHLVEENTFHTCDVGTLHKNGTTFVYNGTYNELALLLFSSKDEAMKSLYLRNSHRMFNYGPLFVSLGVYFFMVCWAAGTSVSAGILVPMLLIGSLYGRIVGLVMVDIFGVHMENSYWSWMDPGAFALIGSASFFGGVSRLAPAITVIMMELTNDLKVLLPVMTSVMVAKWVGDFFTHPYFHALLELKCIPFLNQQPNVRIDKRNVKLELFTANNIMAYPVVTLNLVEKVSKIVNVLLDFPHNGFPVLKCNKDGKKVFYGLITRSELLVILEHPHVLNDGPLEPMDDENVDIAPIGYDKMLRGVRKDEDTIVKSLLDFVSDSSKYKNYYVDLTAYTNQSAMSVPTKFSLHRAYILISTLGLRHLTVVNENNQVKGIITRKDLMGFHMVETLTPIMEKKRYFDPSTRNSMSPAQKRRNRNENNDDEDDDSSDIEQPAARRHSARGVDPNQADNDIRGIPNPRFSSEVELNPITESES